MILRLMAPWAIAALCAAFAAPALAAPPIPDATPPLTLREAFDRALERHPGLRRVPLQREALEAERDLAAQPPAWSARLTLENALGRGEFAGVDGAELGLALGRVHEPGARRDARLDAADGRLAALDLEAEARRLDLLAEVARRFLDVLAAQDEILAWQASVAHRAAATTAARRRVAAGASPRAVALAAEAAAARAALDLARAEAAADAARRRLALLWGGAPVGVVTGDLLDLPAVDDIDALLALLERSPELRRFASEGRLREARLRLAEVQARPEISWDVGVRRLQASGDWALMGGVSVPLGSRERAAPAIRGARAELEALALEREAGALDLRATLVDAHGRLQAEGLAVRLASDTVLPVLERAERDAGAAYRAGALGYLEWSQLQAELLEVRQARIASARAFHLALIELQRLTAAPLLRADGAPAGTLP